MLLVAVLAAGAALRFWHIGGCGLSMWDEYSYVRSARWIATFGRDGHPHAPNVAPPLYPLWMAACFLLAGYRDWVAIGASAMASFLTLPALYLLGTRLYGKPAALVATAFLAADPFNVIFARQAITDATFQLLFVVAVLALLTFIHTGTRRWLWCGGIALGLCEMTKYHGFFAWCAVAPEALRPGPTFAIAARRLAARLLPPAALGFVISLPWFLLVAYVWGVGKLLKHYVNYSSLRGSSNGGPARLLAYLMLWCGPWLIAVACVGLAGMVRHRREGDRLILAWLLLFGVGSFFYVAYPRLILPLTGCLGLAAGRSMLMFRSRRAVGWAVALVCAVAVLTGWRESVRHLGPYGPGYRAAGAYLASQEASGEEVATLTQPVLWHYLGHPAPDLGTPGIERRLRAGDRLIFAVDLVVFLGENRLLLQRNEGAFELVQTFRNPMSETDILTTLGLDGFREYRRNPRDPRWDLLQTIQVYRVTRPWIIPSQETRCPTSSTDESHARS